MLELDLDNRVPDAALGHLLPRALELEEGALGAGLAPLGTLVVLKIRTDEDPGRMGGQLLASLPRRNLKELDCTQAGGITDEALAVLRGLPLRTLELDGRQLTDASLACRLPHASTRWSMGQPCQFLPT